MNSFITKGLLAVLPFLLSGCASYYTHYAVFPAENSKGEDRQVKLTWQTAEFPEWWFSENKSTPITLETQCSTRRWRIVDDTHSGASKESCSPGIRACGTSAEDRFVSEGASSFGGRACMRVNPSDNQARVTDISSSLELLVSCEPVNTTRQNGDEQDNIDYLRASPVPYTIYSRKGVRGRLDSKPPELDDSACDND